MALLNTLFTALALGAPTAQQSAAHAAEHTVTIFIIEIVLMLLVGRLLGELMQRSGQPAVMGHLIAGIVIGPSVLGAIAPGLHHTIFPDTPEQKKMIDAISQLGVLMLLLLTGMETDLGLVKSIRKTAFFVSVSGVIFPFTCGFLLGEMLPDSILPDPSQRLITSLFLATALSISSVKIVAMVIMEVDFLRRTIGQVILASAILDDTIGWIVVALIGGLASYGTVNIGSVSFTVLGTVAFLAFSFTVGRRIMAYIIRWTNDNLRIELPVITAILVMTMTMALITDFIGVHTVLGAFVAGILIGQSPILTKHIQEQLRGLIVAFFAPVFFAVAGLSIDITALRSLALLQLAVTIILIASLGKVVGCFLGGRLGGLTAKESVALAIAMNARGSTEVIVASLGLTMGALSRDLFTLIVVMAVTTTMVMPPLLRWALARIPPTDKEEERLKREAAEANDFVPKVERLLITADMSEDGRLASILGGLFAGARNIMATVLDLDPVTHPRSSLFTEKVEDIVKMSIEFAASAGHDEDKTISAADALSVVPAVLTSETSADETQAAILKEVKKGYDLLFFGLDKAPGGNGDGRKELVNSSVERIVRDYEGPMAIVIAKEQNSPKMFMRSMNILVPTTGTDYSRRAAEVAIAIAKACKAPVTALHVTPPQHESFPLRDSREPLAAGRAVVRNIKALGDREGVKVKMLLKVRRAPEAAILRQARRGRHSLVVLGVKVRPAEKLFFGHRITILLERTPCSILIVNS